MKIIVNDVAASQGGALAVLNDFYQFVLKDEECKKHQWIFLLSDYYVADAKHIAVYVTKKIKKSWLHRLLFELFGVKKLVQKHNADFVLSLQNNISSGISVPQGVYIHQSIPFQTIKKFSFFKKEERIYAVYQYIIGNLIKLSARKASLVIVQTEWMRQAVAKMAKCNIDKIRISRLYVPEAEEVLQKYNPENRFFYPAFESVYKNQTIIEKACMKLNKQGIDNYCVELTTSNSYQSANIRSIGTIPFSEVKNKYNASILIFPSYIETVGLPLLEAAQHRSIIFCSDCEYSHETLGNYENAYYFDPMNEDELTELMKDYLNGKIQHKDVTFISNQEQTGWKEIIVNILKFGG